MVDIKFDMQLFADITVNTSSAPWNATSGVYISTDGATWAKVDESAAAAIAENKVTQRYDASTKTLEVTSDDALKNATTTGIIVKVATFKNDAVAQDATVTDATATQAAGDVVIDAGNEVTLTDSGSVTSTNNTVTAFTGNLTIAAGTISFNGASGTVIAGATAPSYTLASTVADITVTTGAVANWTAGTIATSAASVSLLGDDAGGFASANGTTFTAAAGVKFTKVGSTAIDVTAKTTSEQVTTSTADSTLEITTAGQMTLTSGTFATIAGYGDGIDISGTVTVTNIAEFTSATATLTDAKTAAVTAGTMELVNNHAITSVTANKIAYTTTASTLATFNGATGAITDLTAGTVANSTVASMSVKGTTYTKSGEATDTLKIGALNGTVGLVSGSIVGSKGVTYSTLKTDLSAAGDTVTVNSSDSVVISSTDGQVSVTGLETVGDSVEIVDKTSSYAGATVTYTVISEGVYQVSGGTNDGKCYYAGTITDDASSLNAFQETAITTRSYPDSTAATSYKFTAAGTKSTTGTAASMTTSSTTKTLTVNEKITAGVDMTNDTTAVSVTDAGTATVYTASSTSQFTANGAKFTSTNGVISGNSTGTLTLVNGKSILALGTVNVDASAVSTGADDTITYQAGEAVSGAKITLYSAGTSPTMVLTEAGNNASDATATVISNTGSITGLEGTATIVTENLTDGATIQTANSGTLTFNKATYTVAGDDNGVTFTAGTTAGGTTDTIVSISGLATDATVTTGKLSNVDLSVYGGTAVDFAAITAANGAVFTAESQIKTSIQLLSKGDTVTVNNYVYTVNAMGSAGDYITISSDGHIYGLNDGDKLTVTGAAGTSVYEAADGILKVTRGTAVTDYTLSDSSDSSFTISNSAGITGVVDNGEEGQAVTATFGTNTGTTATTSLVNGMYINADGSQALTADKAVAQVSLTDTTTTYQALTDKGQTVTVNNNTNDTNDWVINTRGGKDTITYAGKSSNATIDSGAGADEVYANGSGDKVISVGEGKDYVSLAGAGSATVNAGAGKDTIVADGTGDVIIYGESGDNVINASGHTVGDVSIVGGAGKDTITASGADDVVSGGDGADTFNVSAKSMTISDYAYGTDVLQAASVAGAVTVTPANFGGDGIVTIASGVTADVSAGTGTGEFWAVSMVDSDGKNKQNVAWAKEGGSNIDISTYDQAVTLIGDTDGKNTLYAGTKADTIYSYADNDSVYGGAGKDYISLASGAAGRVVGVATTSSKDTVSGFTASFEDGDSIYMVDGSASEVSASFASNTVTFKDGEGSLQLNSVTTSSTGAVELNVSGAKVALAAASVGGAIAADSTSYADFYMGNDAAVSFAAAEGEVNVDLRNGLDSGAEGAKFSGITAVTGGAGNNTLIGGTAAESIYAGTGASSLWGGAGKDSLIGSTASDAFFIGAGDGSDVVTNFSAAGNENADTVYTLNDITGAKLTSNGVEISVSDTDKLTLKSVTADTAIKFNSNGNAGIAKVGSVSGANNFTYDSTVTYYGGGSKSDKIAFASGSTDNAEIWLDGSQGKAYASIDVVDGANTSGNLIVAGDSSSQSIIGGKGDTSLWGGAGSVSDTLRSSSGGKTMFWWGAGEGNDVVVSASADDSVNLYNLQLSDVDVANSSITNSGVSLALNDGSKLTVQTSRDMTFSIDGQSWTAQHNSKEWKQNS